MRPSRWPAAILLPALFLLLSTCSGPADQAERALERWAPATSPADRRVFSRGSDAEWHTLADRRGYFPFHKVIREMVGHWNWTSREEWEEWERETGPFIDRLSRFQEERFECRGLTQRLEQIRAAGYDGVEAWRRVVGTLRALRADTTLSETQRVKRGERLLPAADSLTVLDQRAYAYLWLSDACGQAGLQEQRRPYAAQAYRLATEAESHYMVCQLLGVIGSGGGLEGSDRAPLWYWHEGRRIAYQHEIWDQWARLTMFLARYYSREGDFARSLQMVNDVLDQLDRVDVGQSELRHLSSCARFYMELDCHEAAQRIAQRIEVLLEADPLMEAEGKYQMFAGMTLAAVWMESGRWGAADSLYTRIAADHDRGIQGVPPYYAHWMEGLNRNGRYAKTLSVYDGVRSRMQRHVYENAILQTYKAEAELELGMPDSAAASLSIFDASLGGRRHHAARTHRDYLSVRVARAHRGEAAARELASEAFHTLEERVSTLSPASQGYLWIDVNDDLRLEMHRLSADDPVTRYGVELVWRDLYPRLGDGRPPETGDLFSIARRRALQTMADLSGAIHYLYAVHDREVWRFTATGDGVVVDTLGAGMAALSISARTAWQWMSAAPADAGAGPEPDLVAVLTELGQALLPEGIARRSERRLLFTGDGFLRRVAFEALNVGSPYTPLASVFEVAGFHPARALPRRTTAGTLIVAAPEVSGRFARRLGGQQHLPQARMEAREAASVLPDATILAGADATREAVRSAWENVAHIYMAVHVVRDPQVPFLSLLPLAGGDDTESYLSVMDVRQADLSGCEMVVLSGCATGAPYVEATISGASLGDAFIDAGAGVAIQTHWEVRDDHARLTMSAFLDNWRNTADPVRAMSDARRELMEQSPHPHFWSAYGVSGRLGRIRPASQ